MLASEFDASDEAVGTEYKDGQDADAVLQVVERNGAKYLQAVGVGSTTVGEHPVTVSKARIYVALVDGQSNAVGSYGTMGSTHPIDPDYGQGYYGSASSVTWMESSTTETKSIGWYPALAYEWNKLTGEKMVVIRKGVGGAGIDSWSDFNGNVTSKTTSIASDVKACINFLQDNSDKYQIVRTGYYWLQGETDAQKGTSVEDYETAYLAMHDKYMEALSVEGVQAPSAGILSVRPCSWTPWLENVSYEGVRAAQLDMANNNQDIYMASIITDSWNSDKAVSFTAQSGLSLPLSGDSQSDYAVSSLIGNGHYSQAGYNILGLDAADNMYKALMQGATPTDFDVVGYNGSTIYADGATISVDDNLRDGSKSIAQIVVRPNPVCSTVDSASFSVKNADGDAVNDVITEAGTIDVAKVTEPLTLVATVGSLTKTFTLTKSSYEPVDSAPASYYWDFTDDSLRDGSTLHAVTSDGWKANDLSYVSSEVGNAAKQIPALDSETGLTNDAHAYFQMGTDASFAKDKPWKIEFAGKIDVANFPAILSNDHNDALANGSSTWSSIKDYLYLYKENGTSVVNVDLRKGGVSAGINQKFNCNLISNTYAEGTWTIANDPTAKTISFTFVDADGKAVTQTSSYTTNLNDFTYSAVLGRFGLHKAGETDKMDCVMRGSMKYVKLWECAHTWDKGVVAKEATADEDGVMTYTCTVCGATKDERIPRTNLTYSDTWSHDEINHWHACLDEGYEDLKKDEGEHVWDDGVESDDARVFTCTVCGMTKTEPIPASKKAYYWDFTDDGLREGSTLHSVSGNGWRSNDLSYVASEEGTASKQIPELDSETGITNAAHAYFKMSNDVALAKDKSWKIEFSGKIDVKNFPAILSDDRNEIVTGGSEYGTMGNYLYLHNGAVDLRKGGTADGILQEFNYSLINDTYAEGTWIIANDPEAKVIYFTFTDASGNVAKFAKAYTTNLTDFTYSAVLGRFSLNNAGSTSNMDCVLRGSMKYVKLWEEYTPSLEEIVTPALADAVDAQGAVSAVKAALAASGQFKDATLKSVVVNDAESGATADVTVAYDGTDYVVKGAPVSASYAREITYEGRSFRMMNPASVGKADIRFGYSVAGSFSGYGAGSVWWMYSAVDDNPLNHKVVAENYVDNEGEGTFTSNIVFTGIDGEHCTKNIRAQMHVAKTIDGVFYEYCDRVRSNSAESVMIAAKTSAELTEAQRDYATQILDVWGKGE